MVNLSPARTRGFFMRASPSRRATDEASAALNRWACRGRQQVRGGLLDLTVRVRLARPS